MNRPPCQVFLGHADMWSSVPEATWEVRCTWTITDHWATSPESLTISKIYHFLQNWIIFFSSLPKFCGWAYHQPNHGESKISPPVTQSHRPLPPNTSHIHSVLLMSTVIILVQASASIQNDGCQTKMAKRETDGEYKFWRPGQKLE